MWDHSLPPTRSVADLSGVASDNEETRSICLIYLEKGAMKCTLMAAVDIGDGMESWSKEKLQLMMTEGIQSRHLLKGLESLENLRWLFSLGVASGSSDNVLGRIQCCLP
jgi:hypothetical protein